MRIETMERDGLTYQQQGQERTSAHFDLTPLKEALRDYTAGYDNWEYTRNWAAMMTAWMRVGCAQRDVPAHVAQEYCRRDRSFSPLPSFDVNEESLPRTLEFVNYETGHEEPWFPLSDSPTSGLGFDFALIRRRGPGWERGLPGCGAVGREGACPCADLAAVSHLDEVRDADLRQSRETLLLAEPEPAHGMSL